MQINFGFAMLLTLLAGLSTGIGSTIANFVWQPRSRHLGLILGFSAGVMVYVSFVELFAASLAEVGFLRANIGFFAGVLFVGALDVFIPHQYKHETLEDAQSLLGRARIDGTLQNAALVVRSPLLLRTGILTALGIAIHNFPEGLAVFASAATGNQSLGIVVALAIALHNIPEGISVSVPIMEATGSRLKAFVYSFSAGLAEPLGALIGYGILRSFLTPQVLFSLLAFSAGVMVYISLDELLPAAHRYGEEHLVIVGIAVGMLLMAASLYLIRLVPV